jgi:hypothetical protein
MDFVVEKERRREEKKERKREGEKERRGERERLVAAPAERWGGFGTCIPRAGLGYERQHGGYVCNTHSDQIRDPYYAEPDRASEHGWDHTAAEPLSRVGPHNRDCETPHQGKCHAGRSPPKTHGRVTQIDAAWAG